MKFFPLVYSLFMFILVANVISIIPYTFSVTSQIIITATFALLVFFTVLTYGLYKNGLKFFKIFVPPGVPIYILPLVVAIEIVSFLSRPLSHSVRLFANMLAGHITLKVFAGFVAMLGTSLGAIGWIGGIAPLALTRRADRARAAGRVPAGLCVCDPELHLSQRRHSSGTLGGRAAGDLPVRQIARSTRGSLRRMAVETACTEIEKSSSLSTRFNLSSCAAKNIPLPIRLQLMASLAYPALLRGAYRDRHERWARECDGRGRSQHE
jgi:ATP synthase A chain